MSKLWLLLMSSHLSPPNSPRHLSIVLLVLTSRNQTAGSGCSQPAALDRMICAAISLLRYLGETKLQRLYASLPMRPLVFELSHESIGGVVEKVNLKPIGFGI